MKYKIISLLITFLLSIGSYIHYHLFSSSQLQKPLSSKSSCSNLVAYGFPKYKQSNNKKNKRNKRNKNNKHHDVYLCHNAYALAYSTKKKLSVWVAEDLKHSNLYGQVNRTDNFEPDPKLPYFMSAKLSDYHHSGYDRGHMAPAADFTQNKKSMKQSFYLTNMEPQVGKGMNRGVWEKLEAQTRQWAEKYGNIYVITGPIFKHGQNLGTIGWDHIPVPTDYYKILINKKTSQIMSFIVPNKDLKNASPEDFVTTLAKVEQLTGLSFIPNTINNQDKQYILHHKFNWFKN